MSKIETNTTIDNRTVEEQGRIGNIRVYMDAQDDVIMFVNDKDEVIGSIELYLESNQNTAYIESIKVINKVKEY